MLTIHNLSVALADKTLVNSMSLVCKPGSIHALMGQNGSGKTSLAYTIMGHPRYAITHGSITYNGVDLAQLPADKRAAAGIFLAHQYPLILPGVSVFNFLKELYQTTVKQPVNVPQFHALALAAMDYLKIPATFLERSVNEGFSGGEKKRLELLQAWLLKPTLLILDELDSGLDIDALNSATSALLAMKKAEPSIIILLITHYTRVFEYLSPDAIHVMHRGRLIHSGDGHVATKLDTHGYDGFIQQQPSAHGSQLL